MTIDNELIDNLLKEYKELRPYGTDRVASGSFPNLKSVYPAFKVEASVAAQLRAGSA
jgi:hypothetical protein